jgi:hypothetical protein
MPDDCNIYVQSQAAGERVLASVTRFLEDVLRLRVNREKSAVERISADRIAGIDDRGRDGISAGMMNDAIGVWASAFDSCKELKLHVMAIIFSGKVSNTDRSGVLHFDRPALEHDHARHQGRAQGGHR